MDIFVMGQLLLGLLTLIAVLGNMLLLKLGRRQRRQMQGGAPFLNSPLIWVPIMALLLASGGVALAESSLLSFRSGQGIDEINWFVIGMCLVIFADVCSAFALIALREVLKTADTTNSLEMLLASLSERESFAVEEPSEEE